MMTTRSTKSEPPDRANGTIVKRYRKRDQQYTYGLRIRAYGQRYWVPLGTEREGWNERRAIDRRDEITTLVRRGAWRPPDTFELDPREKNPGFHELATDWLTRFKRGKDANTTAKVEYLLSHHALPYLKDYRLDEIDYAVLSSLVARRLQRNDEIEEARAAGVTLKDRIGRPRRTIGARTINMTLDMISRILDDAVKRGLLHTNPAADAQLRLKVSQRRGNFLEADELLVVLEAAGMLDQPVSPETMRRATRARTLRAAGQPWKAIAEELDVAESTAIWLAGRTATSPRPSARRALLATLGCAGLRNSEACELDLGDLDFARGTINVRDAKTDAGGRRVDMTPWLREELLAYRAGRADDSPGTPAFPTRNGHRRDRSNLNRRVLGPAVRAASQLRSARRESPLPDRITPHTLRRTYITLMLEAGAPVPYVQGQVGHEDATTTLNIYAQVLKRQDRRRHGQAFDALMAGTVPSGAPVMIPGIGGDSDASGHRNPPNSQSVTG
jgi:integrase